MREEWTGTFSSVTIEVNWLVVTSYHWLLLIVSRIVDLVCKTKLLSSLSLGCDLDEQRHWNNPICWPSTGKFFNVNPVILLWWNQVPLMSFIFWQVAVKVHNVSDIHFHIWPTWVVVLRVCFNYIEEVGFDAGWLCRTHVRLLSDQKKLLYPGRFSLNTENSELSCWNLNFSEKDNVIWVNDVCLRLPDVIGGVNIDIAWQMCCTLCICCGLLNPNKTQW